jgi:hypothetical protein
MISVQNFVYSESKQQAAGACSEKTSFYNGFQDGTLEGDLDDLEGNTQFLEYLGLYM